MARFGKYLTVEEYWEKYHEPGDGFSSIEAVKKAAKDNRHCINCRSRVWRLAQTEMCFTCTTGENYASEDLELYLII